MSGVVPSSREFLVVMPAGGVGVRQPVRDVEPAEVVGKVELTVDVVAQQALAHGVDDGSSKPSMPAPGANAATGR